MPSPLNERQAWALAQAQRAGAVAIGDMRGEYPDLHPETLRLDLRGLVDQGYLVPVGDKRGRAYVYPEAVDLRAALVAKVCAAVYGARNRGELRRMEAALHAAGI